LKIKKKIYLKKKELVKELMSSPKWSEVQVIVRRTLPDWKKLEGKLNNFFLIIMMHFFFLTKIFQKKEAN